MEEEITSNFDFTPPQPDDAPRALNNLPPEVLGEIFVHCLPYDPLDHIQPDTDVAPMLLCQVSSRWRGVALQTPRLWIHLYFYGSAPRSLPTPQLLRRGIKSNHIDFLRWWMGNVRSPPILRLALRLDATDTLTLSEDIEAQGSSDVKVDDGPFFENILSTASGLRLEECFLIALRDYLGSDFLECPALNALAVRSSSSETVPGTSERLFSTGNTLKRLPIRPTDRLKRLLVDISPFHTSNKLPDSSQMPWAGLTHLSIQRLLLTMADWHLLIRSCVSLRVGEFALSRDYGRPRGDPSDPSVCTPVCLPHLWELTVICENYPIDFNPFANLQLPSLKSLTLHGPHLSVQILNTMFHSFPNLKMLHLAFAFIPDIYFDDEDTDSDVEESNAFRAQPTLLELLPLLEFLALDDLDILFERHYSLKKWVDDLMSFSWFAFRNNSNRTLKELEFRIKPSKCKIKTQELRDALQSHPVVQRLSLKTNLVYSSLQYWELSPESLRSWMSPCDWFISSSWYASTDPSSQSI